MKETFILIISFLGALAVCVGGLKMLCLGFYKYADSKLKVLLDIMTTNRFTSFLSGIFTTCIIQSSSILTVVAVSLLHSHLISLSQTLWIILGANIGTTFTAWIVYFVGFKTNLKLVVMLCFTASMIYLFIPKKKDMQEIYEVIFGFSLLFLGLYLLKSVVPSNTIAPEDAVLFQSFQNVGSISIGQWEWPLSMFVFVGVGALLSVLFQSSSVAMVLTIFATISGWITIPNAIAIIVGENLGTTSTVNLLAVATNVDGKRAGIGHFLFNCIGFTWFIICYPFIVKGFNQFITGGIYNLTDKAEIAKTLAIFHTMFNVINVILIYPFVPKFVKFLKSLFPNRSTKDNILDRYISSNQKNTSTSFLPIESNEVIFHYLHLLRINFNNILKIVESSNKKNNFNNSFSKCKKDISKVKEELILICSNFNNNDHTTSLSIDHYKNVVQLIKEFGFINEFLILIENTQKDLVYTNDTDFYKSTLYRALVKEINNLWNFIEYGIIKEKKVNLKSHLEKIHNKLNILRKKLLARKSPSLSYTSSTIMISIDRISEHLSRIMKIIISDNNIVDVKKNVKNYNYD